MSSEARSQSTSKFRIFLQNCHLETLDYVMILLEYIVNFTA